MIFSAIGWTDHTVNPWIGCQRVSRACVGCYAEAYDARFKLGGTTHWGPKAPRYVRIERAIGELEKIARMGERDQRLYRVFIGSLCDVFEDHPQLVEPRKRLWEALHRLSGRRPRLIAMLLTKRAEEMAAYAYHNDWPASAWAGITAEDEPSAVQRTQHLLRVKAHVRFASVEPMVERFSFTSLPMPYEGVPGCLNALTNTWWPAMGDAELEYARRVEHFGVGGPLNWGIAGGESGDGDVFLTPLEWFRGMRDDFKGAEHPFFFKQLGTARARAIGLPGRSKGDEEYAIPSDLRVRQVPPVQQWLPTVGV